MADSFAELMKNRDKINSKVQKKIEEMENKGDGPDERFFTLKHLRNEKTGKGKAIIRFMPPPKGEDDFYVKYISYFHQNPKTKKYYVNNSHKSFDKDAEDPAYDYNGKLIKEYNGWEDAKKHLIKQRKVFVSNILVVDDPVEPDNNGKIFLFEYGPQIFDLIKGRINPDPEIDDFEGYSPFDPINGSNLELVIIPKNNIPEYSNSRWQEQTPLAETEEEMASLWEKCYSLLEFVDPNNTKMYSSIEKQKKDLARYLGSLEDTNSIEEPTKSNVSKNIQEIMDDDIPNFDDDDDDEFLEGLLED